MMVIIVLCRMMVIMVLCRMMVIMVLVGLMGLVGLKVLIGYMVLLVLLVQLLILVLVGLMVLLKAAGTEADDPRAQHPTEDEDDEGSHHRSVLTEVLLLRVALVYVEVVCTVSPGPEHHDRAPDEHGEVHDAHHAGGEAVDGHANLLPAVDLSVTLSTLLVHLGPAIDCCK